MYGKNRATDFHRSPRIRSKKKAPRTKYQEPTRLFNPCSIRVSSIAKKGYWKNQPRIFTDLHGFDPRTKHQEQSTKNLLGCLIRVPFVFHPSLKKGIGKTEPRIFTDLHGFDPTAKSVVDRSVGHS